MKDCALAVANKIISYSMNENIPITMLSLIKMVYMVHGFSLAIFNKSAINKRFDTVEAWKYGPVIPSVYHSFKHHENRPITEYTVIVKDVDSFEVPKLQDEEIEKVALFVWNRYKKYSAKNLVDLTHAEGSPWKRVYVAGENKPIPDELTKNYYTSFVKELLKQKNNGR